MDGVGIRSQDCSLVRRRHVAAGPVLEPLMGPPVRSQTHHEPGQVFVFAPEAISYPGTQGRVSAQDSAPSSSSALAEPWMGDSAYIAWRKADIVHAGGEVRKKGAHPLAALAILLEVPLRPDDAAFVLVPAAAEGLHRDGLARSSSVELGLKSNVSTCDGPPLHKEEDDALGPWRATRRASRPWVHPGLLAIRGDALLCEEISSAEHT